ncbi:MAG: integrase family protein [Candidatus Saccharibacteria bacterium]|nr:integrase family protein [Rhodoferax sp.]
MTFDARTAKLLPAGETLTIEGCPGLRLKATATRRTWTYRYKSPADGNMRQIAIGQFPAMSLAGAMGAWEKLRQQRDAGQDVAMAKKEARAVAKVKKSEYLVKDLCADYIAGHIKNSRNSRGRKEMERLITSMAAPIEDMRAVDVTRTVAFDTVSKYLHIPVTAATFRGEMGAAWDYALDAGKIPDTTANWWRLIMRGKLRSKGKKRAGKSVGHRVKRVLSNAEVGELLRWLPNFSTLVSDFIMLYLWTGTRGSEICSMMAEEITEEADGTWWTIPKAKTKNARHELATDLRVPLLGRARLVVRRRMALVGGGKGYLFSTKSTSGHTHQAVIGSSVYNHMPYSEVRPERETPHLPVTHWAPHDLRRTVRTMLAAMKCPDSVAEAILGHMQEGIKGVYNHYGYDAERREWLGALDVRLEELAALES